jgi:segregation and condensation protein B
VIYLSKNLKEKIEALLFATQGLTIQKISEALTIDEKNVLKILESLKKDYENRDSAFIITNIGSNWKLTVKSQHVPVVKNLIPSEFPKSILETLAVIAWKNPAKQSDVIKIRGNKAYNHINKLENYGFLVTKPNGRTCELKLTDKFYDYFNAEPSEIKKSLEEKVF